MSALLSAPPSSLSAQDAAGRFPSRWLHRPDDQADADVDDQHDDQADGEVGDVGDDGDDGDDGGCTALMIKLILMLMLMTNMMTLGNCRYLGNSWNKAGHVEDILQD